MKGRSAGPRWAGIAGRWSFEGTGASYGGGETLAVSESRNLAIGIALTDQALRHGKVQLDVALDEILGEQAAGGILLGYKSDKERYLMAQIGAAKAAYSLSEYKPGFGWIPFAAAGLRSNLRAKQVYNISVSLEGQRVRMDVDGVRIFDKLLDAPLVGTQVGLIAAGASNVSFRDLSVKAERPKVFVAMQFGEPWDSIYRHVIKPTEDVLGIRILRIDEISGPGIIFQDIQRAIEESTAVVAEITPSNTNVFYELGYAHALKKPTILLAQSGQQLPFDIRSYRVIFYDDTIGGKPEVEATLRLYLKSVIEDL